TQQATALIAASRAVPSVLEKGDCFSAARAAIAQALALVPDHGPALLQEAQYFVMMAYRNGDDPDRGEALLERAGADQSLTRRERAEVAFYRGIAARTRGDESSAKSGFARSLAIDPTFRPAMLATMDHQRG
ncbi:MAG: hypothetical protein H0W72_09230, partial [Planctomycetes bacterium]|nr:hypothetical protein [Planctomycetota bacterium]